MEVIKAGTLYDVSALGCKNMRVANIKIKI